MFTCPTTSSIAVRLVSSKCGITTNATVAACSPCRPCPTNATASYGIVAVEEQPSGARRITGIVEKPQPRDAPSNLAVVGRYLLTPRIFDKLQTTQRGAGNEIQLTDGIASLMREEPVHALAFEGVRYDCGTKLGYLQALVEYGLRDAQVGQAFGNYLDEQVQATR